MLKLNPLLSYCKQQQWNPRHLCLNDANNVDIFKEAKSALEAGRPELCLGLLKISEALDLLDEGQIKLRITALNTFKIQSKNSQVETLLTVNCNQIFVENLLEICATENWKPKFIKPALASEQLTELETNIIKEAEITRNNGAAKLSLLLMDRALQHGCTSLWIHHSKALALSQIRQFDLAHQIWDALIQHKNVPDFISVVEEAYRESKQRQQSTQSTPLLQALIARIKQDYLQPQALPCSGDLTVGDDLQTLILQEAETQRNADEASLSLDLLNLALDYGCDSLWLFHNKALALQKLGQLEAAIATWNDLSHHQVEGFSSNVQTELGIAEQELILQGAKQAEASGDLETAIETLTNSLLNDPNQATIESSLKDMLRKRRHGGELPSENSPMENHLDELDLNHVFLMLAEERLARTKSLQAGKAD